MSKKNTIIKSPYIEPFIFKDLFYNYILNNENINIKLDYNKLANLFYESITVKYYNNLSENLILNNVNYDKNLILYMNFKSHNILINENREKMYNIIKKFNPNIICLSEALVPITINNNKYKSAKLVKLDTIENDIIIHPYKSAKEFEEKKIKQNGKILEKKNIWKNFFINNGFKYILFATPTNCPWGENWGNCIILKNKPDFVDVLQMKSYGKTVFNVEESRNMIICKINNEYICTTHLDNNNNNSRINQTKEIIKYIKNLNIKKNEYITLLGDLNAINKKSYNKDELKILKLLNFNKDKVPTDAVDLLNSSKLIGTKPINTGQKYESLYQKCVTHVYSTKYKNNVMIISDATDLDHQPIFIW